MALAFETATILRTRRAWRQAPRKLAVMMVTYAELGPAEFRSAIGAFIAVYEAAMNPPERMLAGREAILDRHAANPGFRALAALLSPGGTTPLDPPAHGGLPAPHAPRPPGMGGSPRPPSPRAPGMAGSSSPISPLLAGFTYGFHGAPGQWWHDVVAGALALSFASASRAPSAYPAPGAGVAWLDDSFEVAELHVRPAYQGMGIGRELLLRLTSGRPERTAVLSTADAESRARRLYRGVGFIDLLTGFRFSGGEPPYAVMGARLPLRGASASVPRSPRPNSW
jgi:GNAT superfamily N-acetyltransferase